MLAVSLINANINCIRGITESSSNYFTNASDRAVSAELQSCRSGELEPPPRHALAVNLQKLERNGSSSERAPAGGNSPKQVLKQVFEQVLEVLQVHEQRIRVEGRAVEKTGHVATL